MTKIVICWSNISGYMAACWRALASRPDVDVFVLGYQPSGPAPFDPEIMDGLRYRLLNEAERSDLGLVSGLVRAEKPDVVLVVGWFNAMYRALVRDPALSSAKLMMGMDTPWRGTLRQHLARFRLHSYLRRFDTVLVPGERAFQYAIRLGIAESKICRGLYGIDYERFSRAYEERKRLPGGWPRQFLFTGRYHEEKGLDVLVEAYKVYRKSVPDPWGLTCCGAGPLKPLLAGVEGLIDLGFVQPNDQIRVYANAGAFVLPSRSDPWPLAIVEACAAGLPIICTNACGSAVELVRDTLNGRLIEAGCADALAQALRDVALSNEHNEMGSSSSAAAKAYSSQYWPRRALAFL